MPLLTIITILLIISAAFSYLNDRLVKLPGTIGVVTISVIVSILILLAGNTSIGFAETFKTLANSIDFSKTVLDVMLGFLLFASAIHFDYQKLKEQRTAVFYLAHLVSWFLPVYLAACFI